MNSSTSSTTPVSTGSTSSSEQGGADLPPELPPRPPALLSLSPRPLPPHAPAYQSPTSPHTPGTLHNLVEFMNKIILNNKEADVLRVICVMKENF